MPECDTRQQSIRKKTIVGLANERSEATTDNLIRAIDLQSGKTVCRAKLPAGGQATPITYEEDGR
jgi:glucose dehydrogenase